MLNTDDLFICFQLAVNAYVICCVLTQEKYLLSRYDDFLMELNKKHSWLAYPLGYCEKCFCGQTALIYFLLYKMEYRQFKTIQLWELSFFICFSIVFISIIKQLLKKCK